MAKAGAGGGNWPGLPAALNVLQVSQVSQGEEPFTNQNQPLLASTTRTMETTTYGYQLPAPADAVLQDAAQPPKGGQTCKENPLYVVVPLSTTPPTRCGPRSEPSPTRAELNTLGCGVPSEARGSPVGGAGQGDGEAPRPDPRRRRSRARLRVLASALFDRPRAAG
jgi:hypothetical protein